MRGLGGGCKVFLKGRLGGWALLPSSPATWVLVGPGMNKISNKVLNVDILVVHYNQHTVVTF